MDGGSGVCHSGVKPNPRRTSCRCALVPWPRGIFVTGRPEENHGMHARFITICRLNGKNGCITTKKKKNNDNGDSAEDSAHCGAYACMTGQGWHRILSAAHHS